MMIQKFFQQYLLREMLYLSFSTVFRYCFVICYYYFIWRLKFFRRHTKLRIIRTYFLDPYFLLSRINLKEGMMLGIKN